MHRENRKGSQSQEAPDVMEFTDQIRLIPAAKKNNMLLQRHKRAWLSIIGGLVTVCLISITPLRTSLDQALYALGFGLFTKSPPANLVVVEIDSKSIQALGAWPWSRSVHAQLLKRLQRENARKVLFDLDFSSVHDDLEGDDEFASAMRNGDLSIVLASHWQTLSRGSEEQHLTRPLDLFSANAAIGFADVSLDTDGLVRKYRTEVTTGATDSVALATALRHGREDREEKADQGASPPLPELIPLDFSFDLTQVKSLSYIDVLQGNFLRNAFNESAVFIGLTAAEFGNAVAVPVYQSIPNVYVHALASMSMQRPITPMHDLTALLTIACVVVLFFFTYRRSWIIQTSIFNATAGLLIAGTWLLQSKLALQFAPALPLTALVGLYLTSVFLTLLRQRQLIAGSQASEAQQTALVESLFAGSADSILLVSPNLEIIHANKAANAFLARGRAIAGQPLSEYLAHFETEAQLRNSVARSLKGGRERIAAELHGIDYLVEVSASKLEIETSAQYLVIVRDVTKQQQQSEKLAYQATHDPLTGLSNRNQLNDKLKAMTKAGPVALLMIDLDRFKHINDTLGHMIGDEVLAIVARRLESRTPTGSVVARFGGDEFCIGLPGVDLARAQLVSHMILEVLREPISVAGVGLEVGSSIGIAMSPEHAAAPEALIQKADIALYSAKSGLTSVEVFSPEINSPSVRQLQIAGALRKAIETSALRMNYQPKFALKTGELVGLEALVRWCDPELGEIVPGEFIGLAEETDLIHPLTEWTLRRSLQDMRALGEQGVGLSCAINISARHFRDFDFARYFTHLCKTESIAKGQIELEITESALMHDPQRAIHVIDQLRETGATLAVDDFGTGFSSLGYLKQFDVNCLKIDKCFVDELVENDADRAIVQSVVQLAHNLGMSVVAEGVETEGQAKALSDLGCDVVQGYFYSRPLELTDLKAQLGTKFAPQKVLPFSPVAKQNSS